MSTIGDRRIPTFLDRSNDLIGDGTVSPLPMKLLDQHSIRVPVDERPRALTVQKSEPNETEILEGDALNFVGEALYIDHRNLGSVEHADAALSTAADCDIGSNASLSENLDDTGMSKAARCFPV